MGFKDLTWRGDQSQQKDPQFLGLQKKCDGQTILEKNLKDRRNPLRITITVH